MSPSMLLKVIRCIALAIIVVTLAISLLLREDHLHRYIRLGYILTDATSAATFNRYIEQELPADIQAQLSFGHPRTGAVTVYVLKASPDNIFALAPFNAAYDAQRDAIFVDKRLLDLAGTAREDTSSRAIFAFILLHELGHRLFDRGDHGRHDFLNSYAFPDSIGVTSQNHDFAREIRADHWAAQRFAEFKTNKVDGVRIEPPTLPLMNLPEGLMTELTQYGPYTPLLGDLEHPTLFNRLERFYQAMSEISDFRPDIAREYAVQAAAMRLFLHNMTQHGLGIISLPNGHIPIALAIQGSRVWIISNRSQLMYADITGMLTGLSSEVEATNTHIPVPHEVFEDEFICKNRNLYIAARASKIVYCLPYGKHKWLKIPSPHWSNAHIVDNELFLSEINNRSRTFSLHKIAENGLRFDTMFVGELNRLVASSDSVRLIPSGKSLAAAIFDNSGSVSIVSTRTLKTLGTSTQGKTPPTSLRGRYIVLIKDRPQPDPRLKDFQFDWTSHALWMGTDSDGSHIATRFADARTEADIIDLELERTVLQDVMVSTNSSIGEGSIDIVNVPGLALLGLQDGKVTFADNYLCTTGAIALASGARPTFVAVLPYSRFVTVLQF